MPLGPSVQLCSTPSISSGKCASTPAELEIQHFSCIPRARTRPFIKSKPLVRLWASWNLEAPWGRRLASRPGGCFPSYRFLVSYRFDSFWSAAAAPVAHAMPSNATEVVNAIISAVPPGGNMFEVLKETLYIRIFPGEWFKCRLSLLITRMGGRREWRRWMSGYSHRRRLIAPSASQSSPADPLRSSSTSLLASSLCRFHLHSSVVPSSLRSHPAMHSSCSPPSVFGFPNDNSGSSRGHQQSEVQDPT